MLAIPAEGGKEGEVQRRLHRERLRERRRRERRRWRSWEEGGRGRGRVEETRNGRTDQALRRDGFGFEGWHNVEGGGGRIGGWLSN